LEPFIGEESMGCFGAKTSYNDKKIKNKKNYLTYPQKYAKVKM
jgi:hypothetical protein